jgi:hypothetical protein
MEKAISKRCGDIGEAGDPIKSDKSFALSTISRVRYFPRIQFMDNPKTTLLITPRLTYNYKRLS